MPYPYHPCIFLHLLAGIGQAFNKYAKHYGFW